MGYQIRYGDTTNKYILNTHEYKRKGRGLLILFVCAILVVTIVVAAKGYLIPGDSSVTKAAAKTFQNEIRAGEDIGKAFAAFCKEIVDGANLS